MSKRRGAGDRQGDTHRRERGYSRRSVLAAIGALSLALLGGAWAWLSTRGRAPIPVAPESAAAATSGAVFPASGFPALLAVAEAVVPREGPHPGAGEIDLIPGLERCVTLGAQGPEFYRKHWPAFERALRRSAPFVGDLPDDGKLESVLRRWHREYREAASPSLAATYFEGLRGYVLLAYYTSPEGWASVGYRGPVHRGHPQGGVAGA